MTLSICDLEHSDEAIESALRNIVKNPDWYVHCCDRVDRQPASDLSRWERMAIHLYTKTFANFYMSLNMGLRRGGLDTDTQIFADLLERALQKLPHHDGLVSRAIRVPPAELQLILRDYPRGGIVRWKAFSSCSANGGKALFGNLFFIVASKTGRILGEYADEQDEREVTYLPGATFKVEALELLYDRAIVSLSEYSPPDLPQSGDLT